MGRMGRIACWAASAAVATVLLASGATGGKADASAKCDAAKTKLAGKLAQCVQKMEARRILTGRATAVCDPDRFLARWEKIEQKAGGACANERRDFAVLLGETLEWSQRLSLQIHPPSRIVLYDGGPAPDAAFLGIPGAGDPGCDAALDESFTCVGVAPFVSLEHTPLYEAAEKIAPYPVPVFSRSDVMIAESWDELLDGDLDACLQTTPGPDCTVAAGVLPDDVLFWHGSSLDGFGEASDNCNDFITDSNLFVGNVGRASADGQAGHASPWDGLVAECDGSNLPAPAHLVCACAQR